MRRSASISKPAPRKAPITVQAQSRFPAWLMAVVLVLVTIAVYWPATRCDFVNYDDPLYITDNPHVQAGLSWAGLVWAFGRVHGEGTYWHPLTWVSHMVDCQLYGLKPWGRHLTNVLFHAANAVLVFLVFRRMTGAFWRCAVLAVLFALHPLQVDSVAWVAERKNLLSGFFWLLTTWAYVRYVEGRTQNRESRGRQQAVGASPSPSLQPRSSFFYGLSIVLFALGLMCKPVLVTLPFVLFLLDYWPLRRFELSTLDSQLSTALRLVGEKIPFFVLAVASSTITIRAHQALGMLDPALRLPSDMRVENALISYVRYLGKTFWPSRLTVFYPYPTAWPGWEVVTCGLLLVVLSILVLSGVRSRPSLLVGWFWFLGVLVPFSGLIQVGPQAMADRFMYVPVIGIVVALTWGLHTLAKSGGYQQFGLSVAAGAAMVLCLALTRHQLGYWKDGETLFRHALDVTGNNVLAHKNLGDALYQQGHIAEAIVQFQEALLLNPDDAMSHYNLGTAFYQQSRNVEAIGQFQEALRLNPNDAMSHYNLGVALYKQGLLDEAIRQYREALRLKPEYADAHNNLGVALSKKGQMDEAISQIQEAIRLKPDFAQAHFNLGTALCQQRRIAEGITQFQEAIRLKPDDAQVHYSLGLAFYRQGRAAEAVAQFQEALRLKRDYTDARRNLDEVLAHRGDSAQPPGTPVQR